jgi:hypothetical protein
MYYKRQPSFINPGLIAPSLAPFPRQAGQDAIEYRMKERADVPLSFAFSAASPTALPVLLGSALVPLVVAASFES